MTLFRIAGIGFCCLISAGIASAQNAISAKAGMINYVEGKVLVDGKTVQVTHTNFPQIRNGSELRTEEGRAEVLLGPGVFMRMGENSAVRMVSDDITASRLEFLTGSVIVELAELEKDESVAFTYKGSTIDLARKGVYRLDGEPPRVSVFEGEARVIQDGQAQEVKHAHRLDLEGVAVAEKFDESTGDSLYRWARRRAEYLAVANVSVARDAEQYGFWGSNNWIWNPYYGTYTFLPMGGFYDSYWGYRFWSPGSVYMMYIPVGNYNFWRGGVYRGPAQTGVVTSSRGAGRATAPVMPGFSRGGGRSLAPAGGGMSSGRGGASHSSGGGSGGLGSGRSH